SLRLLPCPPPPTPLFPYTTLFRSALLHLVHLAFELVDLLAAAARLRIAFFGLSRRLSLAPRERREHGKRAFEHFHVPPHLVLERSEEHTSELQSRVDLVCRLLLVK